MPPIHRASASIHFLAPNACKWEKELNERYCTHASNSNKASFQELSSIPLEPDKTFRYVPEPKAAQFNLIGYLPYIIGACIGIFFGLSPLAIMYVSVALNSALTIALSAYILKMLPVLRWTVCCILLLPTVFMYKIFIMPDGLALELCLMMLALTLQIIVHKNLGQKQILFLVGLSFLLGIIKMVYCLIPLILLLIPEDMFKKRINKYLLVASCTFISVFTATAWSHYVFNHYYSHAKFITNFGLTEFQGFLDYVFQIISNLGDPAWVKLRLNNLLSWNRSWIHDSTTLLISCGCLLVSLVVRDTHTAYEFSVDAKQRIILVTIFIGTAMIMCVAMYNHQLSLSMISHIKQGKGVQGRYFIPIIPLLLLSLYPRFPSSQCKNFDSFSHAALYINIFFIALINYRQLTSTIN